MDFNFDEMKNQITDEVVNPKDVNDMFLQDDINNNKIFAALACIPVLFWLPLVAAKESAYARFYANQGLILLIVCVILGVLSAIVGAILGIIPILGAILATIISLVISLVDFAIFLFLFVSALQGKARYIPVIGSMFKIF